MAKPAQAPFGARIRRLRKNLNWSIDRLAQESGLARYHVMKIELGRTTPRVDTLEKLAKALGTTASDLLKRSAA